MPNDKTKAFPVDNGNFQGHYLQNLNHPHFTSSTNSSNISQADQPVVF